VRRPLPETPIDETDPGAALAGYQVSDEWLRKPGSVGKARNDAELVIMDDEGNILPPGQIGAVYSYTPSRPPFAHFKDPEKTEAAKRGRFSAVCAIRTGPRNSAPSTRMKERKPFYGDPHLHRSQGVANDL
jgi:hypothetical protein